MHGQINWVNKVINNLNFFKVLICSHNFVAADIVEGHHTVAKIRYDWPANAGPGRGPALVIHGVGKVATFQLNYQSFPL